MDVNLRRIIILFWLTTAFSQVAAGQTQSVNSLFFPSEITIGQSSKLTLSYSVTERKRLPGLGLRIHFNSASLTLGMPEQLLSSGAEGYQLKDDQADYDNDATTDKYLLIAWAVLTPDGWPQNESFPVTLATLRFFASDNFNGSTVNFSASSLAYKYSLNAPSTYLALAPPDSDSDGLPDSYETDYGLDPNDASDADTDLDGDGASNLDEFLVGSDPTRDELAPELIIPDDLTIAATGHLTEVNFGQASAIDNSDGPLVPAANMSSPLPSGLHQVVWSVADAAGNLATQTQMIKVLPLAELTPSTLVAEGSTQQVTVILSGEAPAYPVTIPLLIDGTAGPADFTLSDNQVVIKEGMVGTVELAITADSDPESPETIIFRLGEPDNAVLGAVSEDSVTITEENIAPELKLTVEQDGRQGRLLTADGGLVHVTASYSDLNLEDSHSFNWSPEVADLPGVEIDGDSLLIDPALVGVEEISVSGTVTDNGNPMLIATQTALMELLPTAPVLDTTADSDGDGIVDIDEGFGDSDDDGIADYLDNLNNIEESYLSPVEPGSYEFMQSEVGTKITIGDAVFEMDNNAVGITEAQIGELSCEPDEDYQYSSGLFDFRVSGKQPGSSYEIVIPLAQPIPEQAVFRTCVNENIGWQNFIVNAYNWVASARAVKGACPEPGSDLYTEGLTPGDSCIELFIEDGGPDDLDGIADGTVTDPSGIALLLPAVDSEPQPQQPGPAAQSTDAPIVEKSSSGGGCTIGNGASPDGSLLLLLLILGLLELNRLRPRKFNNLVKINANQN